VSLADEAIPAATLILVRDRSGSPPELLMVERSEGMAFAAGALVFPGGRIDEADRRLAGELRLGEDGAARIAAIRETIEETAIPAGLASPPGPSTASSSRPRSRRARTSRTSSNRPGWSSIRPN